MFQTAHAIQPAEGGGQDRLVELCASSKMVLAVADGAGGRSGGVEAADLVATLITERGKSLSSQADCERILAELDQMIASGKSAGETTAVLAVVSSNGVCGASVGDSGAWLVNGEHIDDLTAHQIRKPFLGTGAAKPVGFRRGACHGTLLLATDGLLKYTSREQIAATIHKTDLIATPAALLALVRYPSGAWPDDVTISLCRPI